MSDLQLLQNLSNSLDNILYEPSMLKEKISMRIIGPKEWADLCHGGFSLFKLLHRLYLKKALPELTRALASAGQVVALQIIESSAAGRLFAAAPAAAVLQVSQQQVLDLSRSLVCWGNTPLIVMHLESQFRVHVLVDMGITEPTERWTQATMCKFLSSLLGRVGPQAFHSNLLDLFKAGGNIPYASVYTELLGWQGSVSVADNGSSGNNNMQRPMMPIIAAANEQKITSWKAYFAGIGGSKFSGTADYAQDVLRVNEERIRDLTIYHRLLLLLGKSKSPLDLMAEYPFTAPFVHACLVLEDVRLEWRATDAADLMVRAYMAIVANVQLHSLVGFDEASLVSLVAGNAQRKTALVEHILVTEPGFVSDRRILYGKPDLVLGWFRDHGYERRCRFMELFVRHVDAALLANVHVWYPSPNAIITEYRLEAAKRAANVPAATAMESMADDSWIGTFTAGIDGITDEQRAMVAAFIRDQEFDRDHLADVTQPDLQLYTKLPLGAMKRVLRACMQ